MSSETISRLTMPAIVSLIGMAITQAWYLKTATKSERPQINGSPLAILASKTDVIERRPTTRIIWESLGQGELLYGGQAVRTGNKASGKITFIKSGMTIGLEPDSLVIIEEANGKLELNLINGGVFVKNDAPLATGSGKAKIDQPILKAGDKKIEMTSGKTSEINLSMSESGQANVQVTKGDIKIAGKTGVAETVGEGKSKSLTTSATAPAIIEVQGPRSGAVIPLTGRGDTINLTWGPMPDGSLVFLETGTSRDSLERAGSGVSANAKKMAAPVKPGDFFWRLVAVKDGKVVSQSPVTFNQGVVLEAPKLLSYAAGEKIILKQNAPPPEIHLAWTHPQGVDEITIQVAKDSDFKTIIDSKNFNTETEWNLVVKDAGNYFWRVTAHWAGVDRKISSAIGPFSVTKQKDVPTPTPEAPAEGTVLTKPVVDTSGLVLAWSGQEGIDGYSLTLEQQTGNGFKQVMTKQIPTRQFRITNVPAGTYRWTVRAKIGDEESKPSVAATFKIIDLARLTLKDPSILQTPIVFESPDQLISFALAGIPTTATHLRFKIAPANQDLKTVPWQVTTPAKSPQFKIQQAGSWNFVAEVLDQAEKSVGTSETISFDSKAPDRLPAAELLTGKQNLKTGESGDIALKWKPVNGAVRYLVEINGPKTKFRKEIRQTTINMNNLYPGVHTLTLTAIDKNGKTGLPGTEIQISVPDVSSIAAPTTKGIKIR